MPSKRLRIYVTVDGTQYGPDSDVPADVAKKIDNPDVWGEAEAPAKKAPASKSEK